MPRATESYNLQVINPGLSEEWHPTKNGSLNTQDVTPCSNKKIWWICQKGHEWQARIINRTRGTGCPFCFRLRMSKLMKSHQKKRKS